MPKIIIKGKGLVKAQFLNSQVGPSERTYPNAPLAPSFMPTTTTTTKPPIPYAAAQNTPSSVDPFSSNFNASEWAKNLYMQPVPPREKKESFWDDSWMNDKRTSFWDSINKIQGGLSAIDMARKNKQMKKATQIANLPDNYLAVGQQSAADVTGDYNLNTGMHGRQGLYTVNKGQTINATNYFPERGFFNTQAKYGGEQNMKIRITRLPDQNEMAYGGQAKHSLDIRRDALSNPNITYEEPYKVNDTLNPIPRDEANLEAEKGETAYGDLDGDGAFEHMKIGGKRHTEGGTPLNLPEGTFIFSDTKKMKIKDAEVLAYFGLKPKNGGYTPAEIAKRYDVNRYKAIMENPESDELDKSTAQQMVGNYSKKLAYLALIQESMKGFPQGIPAVAEKILGLKAPEEGVASSEDEEEMMQMPEDMQEEYLNGGETELKKYQGDNPTQSSQVNTPPKNPWQEKIEKIQGLNKDVTWSGRYGAGDTDIPAKQKAQKRGQTLYGDIKDTDIEDFKKRHGWFFDIYGSEWNPKNPQDVGTFQKAYNRRARNKFGMDFDFFDPNVGSRMDALDSKFGEYTYNAPVLNEPPPPPPPKEEPKNTITGYKCSDDNPITLYYASEEERTKDGAIADYNALPCSQPGQLTPEKKTDIPYKALKPDVDNYIGSGLAWPRAQYPNIKRPPYVPGRVVLDDPRLRLAENQSMVNAAMQAIGTQGDVRTLNSIGSSLQSQGFANAQNIVGDVQSRNINTFNQYLENEAQRQQAYNQYAADLATQQTFLNKDTDVSNLNALRQQIDRVNKAKQQLWSNRSKLGMLNEVNRNYYIDPDTGELVWKSGMGPDYLTTKGGKSVYPSRKHFLEMKRDFPNLTEEQYLKSPGAFKEAESSVDGYVPHYTFWS